MPHSSSLLSWLRRAGAGDPAPIFVVGAPRSGSALLLSLLREAEHVRVVDRATSVQVEALLAPLRGHASDRLDASQLSAQLCAELSSLYAGDRPLDHTGANSLRVDLLAAALPGARFIYLYRDPREQLGRIIDAWRSGRFVTYPGLPGWDGPAWSLPLVPGWQQLRGKPLAHIAAAQWAATSAYLLSDLSQLPAERWCALDYSALLANPELELHWLGRRAGLRWRYAPHGGLERARQLAARQTHQPRREEVEAALPLLDELVEQARALLRQQHAAELDFQGTRRWAGAGAGAPLVRFVPQKLSRALAAGALSAALLARSVQAAPANAPNATYTVTNTNSSGPGSLRQAVIDANTNPGSDIINFNPSLSGTIVLTDGQILVSDSVTIQGPGVDTLAVSGNDSSRIFYLYNPSAVITATITNLTLQDGNVSGESGGAIFSSQESLLLDTVVISGSVSDEDGGAIHLQGVGDSSPLPVLSLDQVVITNNQGGQGGGVTVNNLTAGVTIRDSLISGNTAVDSGGGLWLDNSGPVSIEDSTISDNRVTGAYQGAPIYDYLGGRGGGARIGDPSQLTIARSEFTGNIVSGVGGVGGGLWLKNNNPLSTTFTINQVLFEANLANGDGGGLNVDQLSTPLLISSSVISGNQSLAQDGGGAYFYGINAPLIIDDTSVLNNSASENGGGLFAFVISDNFRISSSTISGNQADITGGGIYLYDSEAGSITLDNVDMLANTAGQGGGIAMVALDDPVLIVDSLISGNTVTATNTINDSNSGGGIMVFYLNSTITISQTEISQNSARDSGGGIYIQDIPQPTLQASGDQRERAEADIQGIPLPDKLIIDNTLISQNSASWGGGIGALFLLDPTIISSSVITGNVALDGDGGGIAVAYLGLPNIPTMLIPADRQPLADLSGAPLLGPQLLISDTLIANNSALYDGGGMHAYFIGQPLHIQNSTITGNQALASTTTGYGGAGGGIRLNHIYNNELANQVSADHQYDSRIENTLIAENSATFYGGGVSLGYMGEDLIFASSVISGNSATGMQDQFGYYGGTGGGLDVGCSCQSLQVAGQHDRAEGDIQGDSSPGVLLYDTQVRNNSANDLGGGMAVYNSYVHLYESNVAGNTAAYGGGIMAFGPNSGPIISGNDAAGKTGATNQQAGKLRGSRVSGDTQRGKHKRGQHNKRLGRAANLSADIQGGPGGFYLTLTDSAVEDNTAYVGGGIFASGYGEVDLEYTSLSGNSAYFGGGLWQQDQGSYVDIDDSWLLDNSAEASGGGAQVHGGLLDIRDSTISGNTAELGGGLISSAQSSNLLIYGTSLINNTAAMDGGAGYMQNGTLTMVNSTISGNVASNGTGGGLAIDEFQSVDISHSTIVSNTAGSAGGGIFVTNVDTQTIRLNSTIVANNHLPGATPAKNDIDDTRSSNPAFRLEYSLVEQSSGALIQNIAGNVLNKDPQLRQLANNGGPTLTHLPRIGSPALQAGDPAIQPAMWPYTDQRAEQRVWGGRVDIGSVELELYIARLPLIRRS